MIGPLHQFRDARQLAGLHRRYVHFEIESSEKLLQIGRVLESFLVGALLSVLLCSLFCLFGHAETISPKNIDRVMALGSLEAKGLEYDATIVVSPAEIADESPAGLRVLYVALTRATQQLTVVSGERDEPDASGVPDLLRD